MSNLSQDKRRTVVLEPMPPERFDEFAAVSAASHAADNIASGRWLEPEAERLAKQELERLLPQRVATPDHHFYEIRFDSASPVLGFVWLGSVLRGSVHVALVFQLFVYPRYRRQGYGRAALVRVEEIASAMGLAAVALNVSGSNTGAQALYRSLGYVVTSLSMHKPLPAIGVA